MSNMVVNTNVLALNSHRSMKLVGSTQARASARLSSGLKINSAADDAAGLAISEKMRAQIRGLDMASKNSQDAISLVQTAEGGMQEIDNMIQRIRELTVQAANDTNEHNTAGTGDRQKIQDEVSQLVEEIDSMANRVEFNKKKLINGTYADKPVTGPDMSVNAIQKRLAETQKLLDAAKSNEINLSNLRTIAGAAASKAASAYNSYITAAGASNFIAALDKLGLYSTDIGAEVTAGAAAPGMSALQIQTDMTGLVGSLYNSFSALTDAADAFSDATDFSAITAPGNAANEAFLAAMMNGFSQASQLGGMVNSDTYSALDTDISARADLVLGLDLFNGGLVSEYNLQTLRDIANYSGALSEEIAGLQDLAKNYLNAYDALANAQAPGGAIDLAMKEFNIAVETRQNMYNSFDTINKQYIQLGSDLGVATATKNELQAKLESIKGELVLAQSQANLMGGANTPKNALFFQVGANADQKLELNINAVTSDALGIGDGKGATTIDLLYDSGKDITQVLDTLDNALSYVTTERSKLGAAQNRLEFTIKSLDISSENLSASESRIRDTDMAKEMMSFTKANVLQQAAMSMLSQANQNPQNILQLLR